MRKGRNSSQLIRRSLKGQDFVGGIGKSSESADAASSRVFSAAMTS